VVVAARRAEEWSSSEPAGRTAAPRVLIADDHPVLRSAVGRLLARAGYEVVGEAGDGEEATRLALSKRPDVALLDLTMPRVGGLQAARRIASGAPEIRVVIISGQPGTQPIAEAARAGAAAFIAKTATREQLLAIMDAVCEGRAHTATDGAGATIDHRTRRLDATAPRGLDRLTPREREVLRLVAEGHTSLGVACILRMSPRTVETHRQHIMGKLGIHTIAGLTRFVMLESSGEL